MIISVSGTPGTGKTAAVAELKKILPANYISLNEMLENKKIRYTADKKRNTKVVDVKDVKAAVRREIKKDQINIIEGHLSHLLVPDLVVILRCQPDILKKRMKKKGWGKEKIIENLEAELVDLITIEALDENKKSKVLEIDTSDKKPKEVASIILQLLNNFGPRNKYAAGKIDWSERFFAVLKR